jgi:diaminohydroxyphosphoribosylaminopyrimidine deaminase / 5-amino-6-(5-phosphoribosylamino)uracil reductase
MLKPEDHTHMARALELANRGLYSTTPNPRVGCVIVRDGAVVGEGWHERAGGPHAEIHALLAAGARARGATVYVTLEPCSHQGRTSPCVPALLGAGVARVVVASTDPNPLVNGHGLGQLREAGIAVENGLLEKEAQELNAGFFSRMTRGRPWMRLKIAASLDGRTALANGASRWITGEAARADAHHWRARACAVLTGIGTVQEDDPLLTVRAVATARQPIKVLIDSRLGVSPQAKLFDGNRVLIFCAVDDKEKARVLQDRGVEIVVVPDNEGKVDLAAMAQELGKREINEVLIEAGVKLNGSLVRAGVVDELLLYLAPHLLGDTARAMFSLPALTALAARRELALYDVRQIGNDLRILARFN